MEGYIFLVVCSGLKIVCAHAYVSIIYISACVYECLRILLLKFEYVGVLKDLKLVCRYDLIFVMSMTLLFHPVKERMCL